MQIFDILIDFLSIFSLLSSSFKQLKKNNSQPIGQNQIRDGWN